MTATALLIVAAAAFAAPLLSRLAPGQVVPLVVVEIALGIAIGPLLGLVHESALLAFQARLGLAFLFFLAGREIDPRAIRGRPLRLAVAGWAVSLFVALALCAAVAAAGLPIGDVSFAAAALCTTALGVILPTLRERRLVATTFGTLLIAAGLSGELFPIVQIALAHATSAHRPLELLYLGVFTVTVLGCVGAALRRPAPLARALRSELHATAQLPVRGCLLVLVALVYLAQDLGLDVVLGAFAAGMVTRLGARDRDDEALQEKLEAIGFGFLLPVFFITTGLTLDLTGLLNDPAALALVPILLLALLAVRGAPVVLYRRDLELGGRISLALYSSTALPLVVAITTLAVADGHMPSRTAAAFVAAGMLSVLLFPLMAQLVQRRTPLDVPARPSDRSTSSANTW